MAARGCVTANLEYEWTIETIVRRCSQAIRKGEIARTEGQVMVSRRQLRVGYVQHLSPRGQVLESGHVLGLSVVEIPDEPQAGDFVE